MLQLRNTAGVIFGYMKKKILITVVVAIVLISGGFIAYKSLVKKSSQSIPQNLLGGDRDEHGCIGSAGYMWCETSGKCVRPWEESCEINAREAIRDFLANKYGRPSDEVKVTMTKEEGLFASGSVVFGKGGPGEGGVFLAWNNNGNWEVVFDGNGNVDCEMMRTGYGFPDTILKPNYCD